MHTKKLICAATLIIVVVSNATAQSPLDATVERELPALLPVS